MNTAERAIRLLQSSLLRITKGIMQEIPDELAVYINENFGKDTRGIKPREANTTKRLRIVSGNLLRSTLHGEEGNVSNVSADADGITVEYGVDLSVIPYARIHDLGGTAGRGAQIPKRPYLGKGFEDFIREEFPRYIKRIQDRLEKEFNNA